MKHKKGTGAAILAAGLRLLEKGGQEAVTMRRVAADRRGLAALAGDAQLGQAGHQLRDHHRREG